MPQSIERLHLMVNGLTYALAPLESVEALKSAIVDAVRSRGGFVDVTLDDGQRLSILVAHTTAIIIAAETIALDARSADGCSYQDAVTPFEGDSEWPIDLI